jgi:predicted DNA-binding protein
LKVAEGIEDASERARALGVIALGMTKTEMLGEWQEVFYQALRATERIKDAEKQAEVLKEIAVRMAMFPLAAFEAMERIKDKEILIEALTEVAKFDFDTVLEEIEFLETSIRSDVLMKIAEKMAEEGRFAEALVAAEGIAFRDLQIEVLYTIEEMMEKLWIENQTKEVFDYALRAVEAIEDIWFRDGALKVIAARMMKAGMFEQALEVTKKIENAKWRAIALKKIAEFIPNIPPDIPEMAKAEVERAISIMVSIMEQETGMRTEMLPSVLSALAWRARKGDEKSKEGFLRLLPLCGWSLELACYACGLLAWLYPEMGEEIAGVIAATGD